MRLDAVNCSVQKCQKRLEDFDETDSDEDYPEVPDEDVVAGNVILK